MYWFASPPYIRWAIAGAVLLVAAIAEMQPRASDTYPFAASSISAGAVIDANNIEWHDVPSGLLSAHAPVNSVATTDIQAGTPLLADLGSSQRIVPTGWLTVTTELPPSSIAGQHVVLVITDPRRNVAGVVVSPGTETPLGGTTAGQIAIHPEEAPLAAIAIAQGRAILLLKP